MCTGIVETAKVSGCGKGPQGWFTLERANVSYDHPYQAPLEHALNIDFVNEAEGPSARVAVELTPESAVELVNKILASLSRGGIKISRADGERVVITQTQSQEEGTSFQARLRSIPAGQKPN